MTLRRGHDFSQDLFAKNSQVPSYESKQKAESLLHRLGSLSTASIVFFYGFQFSGYVDSAWDTSRAVVYPSQKTIDAVDKLPKRCSSDSAFCFDSYEGTCEFFFANRSWEQSCPLLKVIQFSVDA
ncbi:hypothetical protein CPB97_010034 [Podila verticillata]|nr:hypothetical protein CPB97_010034 [Podila verticillata]